MKTRNLNQTGQVENYSFSPGQELIWDSGAGFDVVTYQNGSKIKGGYVECLFKTGGCRGHVIPIEQEQLEKFTLQRWTQMRNRYGNAG